MNIKAEAIKLNVGNTGANPELSRNCMGSVIMEILSQRHDDVRN